MKVLAQDETGTAVPVAIETVEAGDLVWSRDEHTGEQGFKVVVETYVRETDELVHVSFTSGAGCQPADGSTANTLVGTAEHPFWSLTRDTWVNMGALEVGERLSLTNGPATVTAVRVELLSEPVKVYNFQVADWHTYYAAPEADKPFVWVHNASRYNQPFGNEDFGDGIGVDSIQSKIVKGDNQRRVYEMTDRNAFEYKANAGKHGPGKRGNISPEPTDGPRVLRESSIWVDPNSTRARVGVDRVNKEFVMFRETHPGKGVYHGYAVQWGELTQQARNRLVQGGMATKRGKIR